MIATAREEFGVPECTNTLEAAGLEGLHRWDIILPNSSRVSLVTYKAIVAVRYPELVLHDQNPIQIGIRLTIIQLSTEDSELYCGMLRRISVQQSRT